MAPSHVLSLEFLPAEQSAQSGLLPETILGSSSSAQLLPSHSSALQNTRLGHSRSLDLIESPSVGLAGDTFSRAMIAAHSRLINRGCRKAGGQSRSPQLHEPHKTHEEDARRKAARAFPKPTEYPDVASDVSGSDTSESESLDEAPALRFSARRGTVPPQRNEESDSPGESPPLRSSARRATVAPQRSEESDSLDESLPLRSSARRGTIAPQRNEESDSLSESLLLRSSARRGTIAPQRNEESDSLSEFGESPPLRSSASRGTIAPQRSEESELRSSARRGTVAPQHSEESEPVDHLSRAALAISDDEIMPASLQRGRQATECHRASFLCGSQNKRSSFLESASLARDLRISSQPSQSQGGAVCQDGSQGGEEKVHIAPQLPRDVLLQGGHARAIRYTPHAQCHACLYFVHVCVYSFAGRCLHHHLSPSHLPAHSSRSWLRIAGTATED